MKRAFLVLGPESSGTRLATRLLLAAGCEGSPDHEQPFDVEPPVDQPLVAWRRSVPHGEDAEPNVAGMVWVLRDHGYDVAALVTTRDWVPLTRSQVVHKVAASVEEAEERIRAAYKYVFDRLAILGIPYWTLSYEALVARPEKCARHLLRRMGLEAGPLAMKVFDGNAKYYDAMGG